MSEDIVRQARCMVPRDDMRTHHSSCYLVHKDCMLIRLADEVERLREAIRRIAERDATLSVCQGNVTVTVEAGLTKKQRDAVGRAYEWLRQIASQRKDIHSAGYVLDDAATLRGLLARDGVDA